MFKDKKRKKEDTEDIVAKKAKKREGMCRVYHPLTKKSLQKQRTLLLCSLNSNTRGGTNLYKLLLILSELTSEKSNVLDYGFLRQGLTQQQYIKLQQKMEEEKATKKRERQRDRQRKYRAMVRERKARQEAEKAKREHGTEVSEVTESTPIDNTGEEEKEQAKADQDIETGVAEVVENSESVKGSTAHTTTETLPRPAPDTLTVANTQEEKSEPHTVPTAPPSVETNTPPKLAVYTYPSQAAPKQTDLTVCLKLD